MNIYTRISKLLILLAVFFVGSTLFAQEVATTAEKVVSTVAEIAPKVVRRCSGSTIPGC